MKRLIAYLLLFFSLAFSIEAQDEDKPIEDNSFLIEEAYNQEPNVIQHITAFSPNFKGDWELNFTQEIPVVSQRHQFSYTIAGANGESNTGFADTALNYRYQLLGVGGKGNVAVAPRFSVILPTGNSENNLGRGAVGFQFNLPVSVRHNKKLVTHWNAGATFTPRAKNESGEKASATDFNLGQSFVWLARRKVNFLLETFWMSEQTVVAPSRTKTEYNLFLNPGVRWAYNFKSGLQIVPGFAVPIGVGPSWGDTRAFFYLSLEHPIKRQK